MATIIYKGFQKEPDESSELYVEILSGRIKRPLIVEFGKPENLNNQSEKDYDDKSISKESE